MSIKSDMAFIKEKWIVKMLEKPLFLTKEWYEWKSATSEETLNKELGQFQPELDLLEAEIDTLEAKAVVVDHELRLASSNPTKKTVVNQLKWMRKVKRRLQVEIDLAKQKDENADTSCLTQEANKYENEISRRKKLWNISDNDENNSLIP